MPFFVSILIIVDLQKKSERYTLIFYLEKIIILFLSDS